MARAAAVTCVSGNISAIDCITGAAPSSENHTPEKNIMGQLNKLSKPPAVSSLVIRAAIINPKLIILNAPRAKTKNKFKCEPFITKSTKKCVP